MPENHTKYHAFHAARIRKGMGSVRRRLASCRSVEITGFTLLELMIVMAIIFILAILSFFKYTALIDQTKETKAIAEVKELARLITEYRDRTGNYPDTLDDLERGAFIDPWGNPYQYVNIAEDDKKGAEHQKARRDRNQKPINTYFDLWSNGADGRYQQQVNGEKSRDDVIYAWDGDFIGLGKNLDELYGKPRKWKHPTDDGTDETPGGGQGGQDGQGGQGGQGG